MRKAYAMLLRLYPDAFRRRYGVEMSLDFADGWADAHAGGSIARAAFIARVVLDLSVSLPREWMRESHLGLAAATAAVTLLLWGLALRPWAWHWEMRPRTHAVTSAITKD